MSNVEAVPTSHLHPKFQKLACTHWMQDIAPRQINHFLTVSLMSPQADVDPEKWNIRTAAQREDLIEDIIRRFDKRFYGRNHMNIDDASKFPFIMLEETRDKRHNPTFAHIHGALEFGQSEMSRFPSKCRKICADIEKLVRNRGLEPNVIIQSADQGVVDYISKNALFGVETINTRATINKKVTEPVSS